MFDSRVLGVDPGLARMGLAVVSMRERRASLVWTATVRTPADSDDAERLGSIGRALRQAIGEHRPTTLALERVAWNRNQVSALQVARATGAVMLVAAEAGLSVHEYSPTQVKSAVTGQGNADKQQVRAALIKIHGLSDTPVEPDAADAVAVALTHLSAAGMSRLAAKAVGR